MAKYMFIILFVMFILLGISMFLVGKYCKKRTLKISLVSLIILITLYCVSLSIDINRTNSLKEPIFAKENGHIGSMIRYDGLGYKIGLEKDISTGYISQSQMTILGQVVAASIADNNGNPVDKNAKSKYEASDNKVSFNIKKGTLTNSKATLIFENHTNKTYIYGEPYSIEYEKENTWYELKPIIDDYGFNMPGYTLEAKESKEKDYNWEWIYGKLKPGKYRIVTSVFKEEDIPIEPSDHVYIAAEFIIK